MLTIDVTQLGFRVYTNQAGMLYDTNISLRDFDRPLLQWDRDRITKRYFVKESWFAYSPTMRKRYYPLFMLKSFKAYLESFGVKYVLNNIVPPLGAPMLVTMKDITDRDLLQTEVVAHLTKDLPETFPFVRPVEMQTGRGKTYTSIKSAVLLGRRTIITAPGLVDQWVESIMDFTTAEPDKDIVTVAGSDNFLDLVNKIKANELSPSFIVFSSMTFFKYVSSTLINPNMPPPELLSRYLNHGTRITDEAHKGFYRLLMADVQMEDRFVIPLTATMEATDQFTMNIIDQHYPKHIRFGGHDIKRYIDAYGYAFAFHQHRFPDKAYMSSRGYSHTAYEQYLLKNPDIQKSIWENVYLPAMEHHFINRRTEVASAYPDAFPRPKCLWICSTKEYCRRIGDSISKAYPTLNVLVFIDGMDRNLTRDPNVDVIVSTPQGMGTGADVKGFITSFATVSADASTLNKQMLGRVREVPGISGIYQFVFFCNSKVQRHMDYHRRRKILFEPLTKSLQFSRVL